MFKPMRLKLLFFLILMFLCTSILVIVSLLDYFSVSKTIANQIGGVKLELLYNYQKQIMNQVEATENIALDIATQDKLRDSLEKEYSNTYQYYMMRNDLNDWLNNIKFVNSKVSSIQVYSDKFKPHPHVGDRLQPLEKMPWRNELGRLQSVNSVWIKSNIDKHNTQQASVLTYVTKVYNQSGETIAYVEVNLQSEALENIIRSDSDQSKGSSLYYLFDSGGAPMLSLNPGGMKYRYTAADQANLDALIHHKEKGIYGITLDGKSMLLIQYPSKYSDWGIAEIIPSGTMYQVLVDFRHSIAYVGLSGLILILIISSLLSSRLIAPIRNILRVIKEIEAENYSSTLSSHFIIEFNQLNYGFNRMARRLKDNIEHLHEQYRLKREAELRVLQSQINPHFLYNTLDIINCMAAERNYPEISLISTKLAHLFRIGLSKGNSYISLKEELQHSQAYIYIQLVRFPQMFAYEETVDQDLTACMVPKVIIQPFIENAIKHGFHGKVTSKAKISVYSEWIDSSSYRIIIEDNGSGLKSAVGNNTLEPASMQIPGSSGYGVRNVDERIKMYFGSQFGVQLIEGESGGTKAIISLPRITSGHERSINNDRTAS